MRRPWSLDAVGPWKIIIIIIIIWICKENARKYIATENPGIRTTHREHEGLGDPKKDG
jgi:hypothetical protein